MAARTLYICRPVLNAAEIAAWFTAQGFTTTLLPSDFHVTVAFSKAAVEWKDMGVDMPALTVAPGRRSVERLGEQGAIVMRLESDALASRWEMLCSRGASWDYPAYHPHMTISYSPPPGVDLAAVAPFPGIIELGPEQFQEVEENHLPLEKAVVITLPALVKARLPGKDGRRLVEVEASCEAVDADGDVILQKALLDSAASFVRSGHLDIDHISEFGHRFGVRDPLSYIVGRPVEVHDIGGGRTSVLGEIRKSLDGRHDPQRNRYDELWDSLTSEPPVLWSASVYGFPKAGETIDCRTFTCPGGATRFLVQGFDWRSLAFTRNPKNQALTNFAQIVSAKSWAVEMAKSWSLLEPFAPPSCMNDLMAHAKCDSCGVHEYPSSVGYRRHFISCKGASEGVAEIYGNALMHHLIKGQSFGNLLG